MLLGKPVPFFLRLLCSLICASQFSEVDIFTTASGSVGVYLVPGGKQMIPVPVPPRQLAA